MSTWTPIPVISFMSENLAETICLSRTAPGCDQIVAECILRNGVCAIPTDTVYGFSGIVPQSKARIQSIKGRDEGKPFIQLIAEPEDIFRYTDCPIPDQLFSLWPGALTMIVPVKDGGTVAFRCPGDLWLRKVIALVGSPIYSTSLNRSGKPVLGSFKAICDEFFGEVEVIVDGDENMEPNPLPSTLVELVADGKCRVLRQGSVPVPPETEL